VNLFSFILSSCQSELHPAEYEYISETEGDIQSVKTKPDKPEKELSKTPAESPAAEKVSNIFLPLIKKEIPPGFEILDTAGGDWNADGISDLAVVLHAADEKKISDPAGNPSYRPLLMFKGLKNGSMKRLWRNDKLIYCINCGGSELDPFEKIQMSRAKVHIIHQGGQAWKWQRITEFALNAAGSELVLKSDVTIGSGQNNAESGKNHFRKAEKMQVYNIYR
jgi:hypothetical protein